MADFNLNLSSIVDELEEDIGRTVIRRFGLGTLNRVIRKSPVDTGRFRGSWVVSIDRMSDDFTSSTDRTGSATLARGSLVLNTFNLRNNDSIYIQNNLPYAARLEAGSSTQAPSGVAGISVREEAEAFNSYGNS